MKHILLNLLLLFGLNLKAQDTNFERNTNTIIIYDSLILMNDIQHLFLSKGYLFVNKSENILITDYKSI